MRRFCPRHPGLAVWRNGCDCFRPAWRLSAWDAASLRKVLRKHDVDSALILDDNDHFSFDQGHVAVFFDAIECRYFEDDLSSERRWADRYSTR